MPAQTRQIWDITGGSPGQGGSNDPGKLDFTLKVKATVPFGRFIVNETNEMRVPTTGDLTLHGISLEDPQAASDQENQQYLVDDIGAVARRGYWLIAIDTSNKPNVGGAVIISLQSGEEGKLTSLVAGNIENLEEHITIVSVLDNVAEVYIDGVPRFLGTLGI